MILPPRMFPLALLFAAATVQAATLPDTGQDTCYNDAGADSVVAANPGSISGDSGAYPRQDCRYGRDAAVAAGQLGKTGAGAKGFDYTKIANNGNTVAPGSSFGNAATDWACTRDNLTGLTWENKTGSVPDLRYANHTYTWSNSDFAENGGNAGGSGTNTCNSTLPLNQCSSQAYVAAVNATVLCGYTDWRMPTRRELLTLVFADQSIPSIDPVFFPNPPAAPFWTATTYAPDPSSAWFVDFADGYSNSSDKTHAGALRLVRGAPF